MIAVVSWRTVSTSVSTSVPWIGSLAVSVIAARRCVAFLVTIVRVPTIVPIVGIESVCREKELHKINKNIYKINDFLLTQRNKYLMVGYVSEVIEISRYSVVVECRLSSA